MRTQDIPRKDWKPFFDGFSRQHARWLASVDVTGADLGAQHEVHDYPLAGITTDAPVGDAVHLHFSRGREHVTHIVDHVTHVRLEQTEDGADVALQLESADERTTLVWFRAVALAEHVDAVGPSSG
jgi:hypothetical protein